MSEVELVLLGEFTAPYGVRGGIKVKSFTQNPEDIIAYEPLYFNEDISVSHHLKLLKSKNNMIMVSVDGITDRNIIEDLRGTKIYTLKDSLPELEEEEFYHSDLVGLDVELNGEAIGRVIGMHNFGAGDIMDIRLKTKELISIPFTKDMIPDISIQDGKVIASEQIKVFYNEKKPKQNEEELSKESEGEK